MLVSNDNKTRIVKMGRIFFFLVGIAGLFLLALGFWVDTVKIGGTLCTGALIGHIATWRMNFSMNSSANIDKTRR